MLVLVVEAYFMGGVVVAKLVSEDGMDVFVPKLRCFRVSLEVP